MIRGFATPKEKEVPVISITVAPEFISVLEDNILDPIIVD